MHPYFFACQYHPEFQSHPHRPSPPFYAFILAASGQLEGRLPLPPLRGPVPVSRRAAGSRAGSVGSSAEVPSVSATPARAGGDSSGASGTALPSPSTLVANGLSSGAPVAPLEKSPARPVPQVTRVTGGLPPAHPA